MRPRYSEAELLAYGRTELATFRADMVRLWDSIGAIDADIARNPTRRRAVGLALADVIRAGRQRRIAAGLTAAEAFEALRLASREVTK